MQTKFFELVLQEKFILPNKIICETLLKVKILLDSISESIFLSVLFDWSLLIQLILPKSRNKYHILSCSATDVLYTSKIYLRHQVSTKELPFGSVL